LTIKRIQAKIRVVNSASRKFKQLIDEYISLEKEIQKLITPLSHQFCYKCSGKCCREEICRESIQSAFLSILIEKQNARYDHQHGWLSPSGCRLGYGRPLVCYDFFCKNILNSRLFKVIGIQIIIHDFLSIGNKAYGNTHLVCIDNLDRLSSKKIEKMSDRIGVIKDRLRSFYDCSGMGAAAL
jgi:hypothetical protein